MYVNGWWFQSVSLSQNGSCDYIQVKMKLRKPVKVEPGQYINLWIPLGPLSVLQSHPFTVASLQSDPFTAASLKSKPSMVDDWPTREQTELKVFVNVNRGLSRNLRHAVKRGLTSNIGLYMGPYGSTIDMKGYEAILLVATGLGVVAVAPYLQWLVHAFHKREICSAPIQLIWHIPSWSRSHLSLFSSSADKSCRAITCGL